MAVFSLEMLHSRIVQLDGFRKGLVHGSGYYYYCYKRYTFLVVYEIKHYDCDAGRFLLDFGFSRGGGRDLTSQFTNLLYLVRVPVQVTG